jgi:branched-subunit amino acid transport protein
MYLLGRALGILTAALYLTAIMNFFVKWINRTLVVKLPKESAFRGSYQSFMRFLVKNHRFFALGAIALMAAHAAVQILFQWVAITGLVAVALALTAATLGWIMFRSKKRTPAQLWAHRSAVIALTAAILIHAITRR